MAEEETDLERVPIQWFPSQKLQSDLGHDLRQEPGMPSMSSTWVAEIQLLNHHCCLLVSTLAGNWNKEAKSGFKLR